MSQARQQSSWSAWALVALALSVGLCPLVTAAAIPFGLLALRDIRRSGRRGRRVAIAAIWIGSLVTPLTSAFAIWWHANVREVLVAGPLGAMQAGQRGDVPAFLEAMGGGDEAAAQRFITAMTDRWGNVQSMRLSETASEDSAPPGSWWVGYDVMFEQGAAPMRALYVFQSKTGAFVLGFEALVLGTPATVHGELRWPPVEGH